MVRGRKKRTPEDVLDGFRYPPVRVDRLQDHHKNRNPINPERSVAPPDQKIFLIKRAWEILQSLKGTGASTDGDQLLYEKATEKALAEMKGHLKSGRALLAKRRGRKPGSGETGQTESAILVREYKLVRSTMRVSGPAYSAVAEHLWRRKYKASGTVPSSQALRQRIAKAVKKADR